MHCAKCGFLNQADSRFCSKCGVGIPQAAVAEGVLPVGSAKCPACESLNEKDAAYCRSCGAEMRVASCAAVMVGPSGLEMTASDLLHTYDEDDSVADGESELLENSVSSRHESMMAKLDMIERELEARRRESMPALDEAEPVDGENVLSNISLTLDSLIADLLDVEIKEYAVPDFIHPDESGFPSRDPAAYKRRNDSRPAKKGINTQEILVIIALIAAIFLVGMSCGLWGSYFLGL